MSSNVYMTQTFDPYTNGEQIAKALQKNVDNASENQILFGEVDYSKAYEDILQKSAESSESDSTDKDGSSTTAGDSSETEEEGGTKATAEDIAALRAEFEEIQDEQGWVGKAFNGIKNFFGTKNSSNKVEETIAKAESGEISLEEAQEKLNTYRTKQKSSVNTIANIASGLAVVAGVVAAPFTGGLSLAATVGVGAAVGAATKVAIKASDAATNKVEGDYSLADGAKDAITGGVGGAVTVATAGIGTSGLVFKETGKVALGQTVKAGVVAGAKAGGIDGAVMGATNYTVDCVFDEDKEFQFGTLVKETATGAAGGAAVGGLAGGVSAGARGIKTNKAMSKGAVDPDAPVKTTDQDTTANTTDRNAQNTVDNELAIIEQQQKAGFDVNTEYGRGAQYLENMQNNNELRRVFDTNSNISKQEATYMLTGSKEATEAEIKNATRDILKKYHPDALGAKATAETTEIYEAAVQLEKIAMKKGPVAAVLDDMPKVHNAQAEALDEMIADGQIQNLDDAFSRGYTEADLKSAGVYDKLNKTTAQATGESTTQAANSAAKAYNNVMEKISKVKDIKLMSKEEVRTMIAGKAGATKEEFETAFALVKAEMAEKNPSYLKDLTIRTFLEDAWNIGVQD